MNRDLIRAAALAACERITHDTSNGWRVTLDSDTQGVAGMCDIPNVIPKKIRGCDIFPFLKSGGAAQTVAHAVVTDQRGKSGEVLFPLYCELLDTSAMFPRQGYGTELFLVIDDKLDGKMEAIAATAEGRAFLTKLKRPTDSLAPHLTSIVSMLDLLLEAATQQGKTDLAEVLSTLEATATDIKRKPHDRIQALGRISQVMEDKFATVRPSARLA